MMWDTGVFFAILAFPAFVAAGMYTAPRGRWLAGGFLLAVILLVGVYECKDNWAVSKTQQWMSGGIGMVLSSLVFWKMRNLVGD